MNEILSQNEINVLLRNDSKTCENFRKIPSKTLEDKISLSSLVGEEIRLDCCCIYNNDLFRKYLGHDAIAQGTIEKLKNQPELYQLISDEKNFAILNIKSEDVRKYAGRYFLLPGNNYDLKENKK